MIDSFTVPGTNEPIPALSGLVVATKKKKLMGRRPTTQAEYFMASQIENFNIEHNVAGASVRLSARENAINCNYCDAAIDCRFIEFSSSVCIISSTAPRTNLEVDQTARK